MMNENTQTPQSDAREMGSPDEIAELHDPVMLDRCIELLQPAFEAENPVVVDGTLGMGGHSEALLDRFPQLTLIGLDRDTEALGLASKRLARFGDRFRPVHTVYDGLIDAVEQQGFERVHGVLLDLGVSSLQLDQADRGFAYAQDAPLDMRMDQTSGVTAAEIIAQEPEGRLRELFEVYGDEPLAGRYARAIVRAREIEPIRRSGQLVDVLQEATPAAVKRQRHPAKRVFQALRIEVNNELGALQGVIPQALKALAVGGRAVVMSYQSLEDRMVKRAFQKATQSTAPAGLPVELPEHIAKFSLVTKGAETAPQAEQERNPRSIPVRLRAIERVREDG
ncbi:16S rRNA (cytosine(1402)-N(4))-methyltransferase RsmH [Leucobacter sp. UCMA 4100]|nr:16S rRNA (cytosine(1402)-N(4))-methyltransferase RsmH [Leucobacter sp. UCMA 4100]